MQAFFVVLQKRQVTRYNGSGAGGYSRGKQKRRWAFLAHHAPNQKRRNPTTWNRVSLIPVSDGRGKRTSAKMENPMRRVCPGRGRRFGDSIQTALPSVRVSDRSGSIDRETHPQQGNHRQADDTLSSRPKAVGLSRLKPRLCRRRNPKPCHEQRSPPQGLQLLCERLRKDLFKDKACRLCAQTSFQNAARLPSSLLQHRLSPHAQEHASG